MLSKGFLLAAVLILAEFAIAQPPPAAGPPSAKTPGETKKTFSWGSVKDLPITPGFVSTEGRFSIGLKSEIDGYAAITPKQLGINGSGSELTWKFDEGEIRAVFVEFANEILQGSQEDLERITKSGKETILLALPAATVREESYFRSNIVFPASKITFDLPDDIVFIQRVILVKNRLYKFVANFRKKENEKYVSQALDSFKIISQEQIDGDLRRKFDAIKPAPLPQEPVVKKLKSDAEDDGLKGKVKQIVLESEDLSGTWSDQGRKKTSETNFNKDGNQIETISFRSNSVPSAMTVCGYIDGKRVFKSVWMSDETNPPRAMATPTSNSDANLKKPDNRYTYSIEYEYVDGRLSQEQLVYNNGKKGNRTVFVYSKNQVERQVYTEDGKLNQKYLSTLDEKGNEIEEINYGLSNYKFYGDRKYRYEYEFDAQGNWIKKTTFKEETENGRNIFKPFAVYYRTITYW